MQTIALEQIGGKRGGKLKQNELKMIVVTYGVMSNLIECIELHKKLHFYTMQCTQ